MASISFIAAGSLILIRRDELNPDLTQEKGQELSQKKAEVTKNKPSEPLKNKVKEFSSLFDDPCVKILMISVALFHIANAPVMPLVGLYLKHLGGGNDQVAWVVLIAQAVMVPATRAPYIFSTHKLQLEP